MASYPHHPDTALEAFSCCDEEPWQTSANMQRSMSQSTSRTVDSSYTASSYSSGYYSTSYSSTGLPPIEDETCFESAPAVVYSAPYLEPDDTDHLLSATGSQYQQSGQKLPQALQLYTPLQLFDSKVASIEEAAEQATLNARSRIARVGAYGLRELSVVKCELVEEARQALQGQGLEATHRAAVQKVVYEVLHRHFNDIEASYVDPSSVLDEAAYQLQGWLQGPEALKICYLAIVAVLAELRKNLAAECSGAPAHRSFDHKLAPARPPAEKAKYLCNYPGCNKGASRPADLDRHYKIVHLEEDEKTKYLCDYKRCNRHADPFFRQDHFRDHLRVYHKEDLLRRGSRGSREWWNSRSPHALYGGWWRCSRCLVRVDQARHSFVCPSCGNPCESERQRYRLNAKA
ncbi:eae1197e-011a-48e8-8355-605b1624e0aa [Thermothielavioides terrestris]|uniref:Eae1197e-011a-48e8-8355-605b1624e0aa n=1 Tax=Thermothielavioides terrestris TaxID=2587410 RepID=A0A3S4BAV3_9PEZI|nr:eae1197e-011a-48e8-8355-605b1624e0aa [Thermothielavioides terrestris]